MPTQKQFNEGRACDAVIKIIEAREGATHTNIRFPEQENHAAPVELVCDIGNLTFASEQAKHDLLEVARLTCAQGKESIYQASDLLSGKAEKETQKGSSD